MQCCNSNGWIGLLLAALLALTAPLRADNAWPALTPVEREMLAPFAAEWPRLDGPMRARLRVLADRWTALPEVQRAREIEKFRRWQALPPGQREQLRDRYRAFQQLDETERANVRDQYQRWQKLSPRERRALRGAIGPKPPVWRRAIRHMDPATRLQLRAAFEALPQPSRSALHQHLRSLDAPAASSVLRDFLDQPAAARAAWIAQLPATR